MNKLSDEEKISKFVRGVQHLLNYGSMIIDRNVVNAFFYRKKQDLNNELFALELDLQRANEILDEEIDENYIGKISKAKLSKMIEELEL